MARCCGMASARTDAAAALAAALALAVVVAVAVMAAGAGATTPSEQTLKMAAGSRSAREVAAAVGAETAHAVAHVKRVGMLEHSAKQHEDVMGEVDGIVGSLTETLQALQSRILEKNAEMMNLTHRVESSAEEKAKILTRLEAAEKEKEKLKSTFEETRHKMESIESAVEAERRSKEELTKKLLALTSEQHEREAAFRAEHHDKEMLAARLRDLESHLVQTQKELHDRSLKMAMLNVAVEISNFLESPLTEKFLKVTIGNALSKGESLEHLIEKHVRGEVEALVGPKLSPAASTGVAIIMLALPVFTIAQIMYRLTRQANLRQLVLALYVMHLALCIFCAASTLALGSDPVVVMHLVNDATASKWSVLVTSILLLLLLAAPTLLVLLAISIATASALLERTFYVVQLLAYAIFVRETRQIMWQPLMQGKGQYSAISWTTYASHGIAFLCMIYLCIRGRPVSYVESVAFDMERFATSVEKVVAERAGMHDGENKVRRDVREIDAGMGDAESVKTTRGDGKDD
mmetsp:Transcript_15052/g.40367  ORF Transcript_15052/g.40367 Transcript_15052/m.40367 type:complete len:521 (+) Transcript_15052:33-1595(+)